MNDFAILTNRRRALIALAHSVIFLGVALHGFAAPRGAASLHGSGAGLNLTVILIYVTVTSALLWLAVISRCLRERIYFIFCACSATFGLLRSVFGDATLPAAQYLRVTMLSSAVLMGTLIVRSLPRTFPSETVSD